MKKITLLFCCFLSFSIFAQITLTSSDFPVAGDVYRLHLSDTTGVLPGSSGTNVTWNFAASDSSVGTMVDSFKTVLSTPYGASYPQSNLALHEITPSINYFVYFNVTGASADRIGNADAMNVITYSNPSTQYLFPVTYGTSGSDTYSASYIDAASGSTIHMHGSGTSLADGTGTIVLPSGTYNNVLRIHYTRSETDTIFTVSSGNFPVHVTEDFYLWFQAGDYYPVFHLQNTANQVSSGPVTHKKVVGWRNGNATAGIPENSAAQLSVYPNPAAENIFIQSPPEHLPVTISLFDNCGKLVYSLAAPGPSCEISMMEFPAGIYLLQAVFADGTTENKKIEHN
jgi:hypothetical protein